MVKFELGEGPEPELREARVLRQRQASDLIDRLLAGIRARVPLAPDADHVVGADFVHAQAVRRGDRPEPGAVGREDIPRGR